MKVLIIGGGGREHSLGWKLSQSNRVKQLFFAPGNAGTASIGINVDISPTDIVGLKDFALSESIDLTVVGVDDALAAGVVDEFRKAGLSIFGPDKYAAQIESSKAFSKKLMQRLDIPTAEFAVFTDYDLAVKYLSKQQFPLVMKASGLALGKGVTICESEKEAKDWLYRTMVEKCFGEAGNSIIIEEYLVGYEVSIHALSDGRDFVVFPPSQDNKPIYDGDTGPNTGGMGVIAPIETLQTSDLEFIKNSIIKPVIVEFRRLGHPYIGCLYPGLMITNKGIKVIEYNARFGDPESQVYMMLLENDLLQVLESCMNGSLHQQKLTWRRGYGVCVVVASSGYPNNTKTGKEIIGLNSNTFNSTCTVFQAGTKINNNHIITSGGRVLGVTAVGKTISSVRNTAYKRISDIQFDGMQYRKDIGLPKPNMQNIVNND